MNKVSLDLKFKAAETEYFKSFSSIINKFEGLFLNYNNIIEEVKRIKLDEVYKMQETQIENQYTGTNNQTGNLSNNKLLLKQSTFHDKRNSPKNETSDIRSGLKTKASFLMANNEVIHEEKPTYGVLQYRKPMNNNLMRKVTKVLTKGGIPGLEGLKKLRTVQNNLDYSHAKNQSSNSIVNLSKANKGQYYGASGLFKKDGETQQVTNTITETDENDEKDKTADNFYGRKVTKGGVKPAIKDADKEIKKTEENKKVSFKRENSASSFDSQHKEEDKEDNCTAGTYTTNTVNTEEVADKENEVKDDKKYLKIEINSPSVRDNKTPKNNNNNNNINIQNQSNNNFTQNTISDNTNSRMFHTENIVSDDGKVPSSLKFYNQRKANALGGGVFQPRRRVSKIEVYNEQNSSFCPINSFIGGSVVDVNYENDKYINEIKQAKVEIQMYKQYISTINDKLENEVKLKNSYLINLREFEKKNKSIYKTEIDNLHVCFEIYKDFYQNELDNRKDVIINLHNTLEEVLAK